MVYKKVMLKIPVGKKGDYALIDEEDYELVAAYNWQLSGDYATCQKGLPKGMAGFKMCRLIMAAPADKLVDHISGRTLDNRRSNLRLVTHQENMLNQKRPKNNTSGYKGVVRDATGKKWCSRITSRGAHYHLGTFETALAAAQAYDAKAIELHGEFARLNLPY